MCVRKLYLESILEPAKKNSAECGLAAALRGPEQLSPD
jgi:hypothetical protein